MYPFIAGVVDGLASPFRWLLNKGNAALGGSEDYFQPLAPHLADTMGLSGAPSGASGRAFAPLAPSIGNTLGLPAPQTEMDNIAHRVGQFVGGTAAGMGLGLGAGGPVGRTLTANPGSQLAAGAAGGAASGIAANAGASPDAQNAIGLFGGLATAPAAAAAGGAGRWGMNAARQFTPRGRAAARQVPPVTLTGEQTGIIGRLNQEVADYLPGKRAGDIRLSKGTLNSIEHKHGGEARQLGFQNAGELVSHILDNLDSIYQAKGNAFDLLARTVKPYGKTIVEPRFDTPPGLYEMTTAHPVRPQRYKNKTPLWERQQTKDTLSRKDIGLHNPVPVAGDDFFRQVISNPFFHQVGTRASAPFPPFRQRLGAAAVGVGVPAACTGFSDRLE